MKKIVFIFALSMLFSAFIAANEIDVTVEITSVKVNGGTVYVAVYNNEEAFKKDKPFRNFIIESSNASVFLETKLDEGYYRISVFQDENNNGKLDTGLFGIPKEPFGISNYGGKGIPGSFEKLKLKIDQNTGKIIINLDYY